MEWLHQLLSVEGLVALLTLTLLEIVLGIDNIVFIAIITGRLDPRVQAPAQRVGLLAAMFMRILLLLAIAWIMKLTATLFSVFGHGFSGKDLILLGGGLFLVGKATHEIHARLEADPHAAERATRRVASFAGAIVQIMLIDIVFSLDSVITAVGLAKDKLSVMILAIIVAVLVMMIFAGAVSRFVERHPTIKMLALAFLILIGVLLVAEAFHYEIPRGYVYFAMAFSLGVELLNLRVRRNEKKVRLRGPQMPETEG